MEIDRNICRLGQNKIFAENFQAQGREGIGFFCLKERNLCGHVKKAQKFKWLKNYNSSTSRVEDSNYHIAVMRFPIHQTSVGDIITSLTLHFNFNVSLDAGFSYAIPQKIPKAWLADSAMISYKINEGIKCLILTKFSTQ